jgi:hypothetical protein
VPPARLRTVGGVVFTDVVQNGAFDPATDTPVPGVMVLLVDPHTDSPGSSQPTVVASTRTNSSGYFHFPPGAAAADTQYVVMLNETDALAAGYPPVAGSLLQASVPAGGYDVDAALVLMAAATSQQLAAKPTREVAGVVWQQDGSSGAQGAMAMDGVEVTLVALDPATGLVWPQSTYTVGSHTPYSCTACNCAGLNLCCSVM